jgi:hypothetical protein
MKRCPTIIVATVVTFFCTLSPFSYAQPVKYEAVQLVEMTMQTNWESASALLEAVMEKLAADVAKSGDSKPSDTVLLEELKKSFSREGFSKALAISISGYMSDAELKETVAFYRTPVGQKWLQFNADKPAKLAFIGVMLKEACAGAEARVPPAERSRAMAQACR